MVIINAWPIILMFSGQRLANQRNCKASSSRHIPVTMIILIIQTQFKIHLEPFDESYGDLGVFKVIVIAGNPVKYNLVPTKTLIPDKYVV